jgi:hypothetical protein
MFVVTRVSIPLFHVMTAVSGCAASRVAVGLRCFWRAVFALAASLLLGCSPVSVEILHFQANPAFTRSQLEQAQIAFLPAMSTSPMITGGGVAEQLARQLAQKRPKMAIVAPERVRESLREVPQLGPSPHRSECPADISREDIQRFGAATGARFLVLVCLEEYSFGPGDRPAYERTGVAKPVGERHYREKRSDLFGAAKPLSSEKAIGVLRSHAEARLVGEMGIFDAIDGRLVWVGRAMAFEAVDEQREVWERPAALTRAPAVRVPMAEDLMPHFLAALVDLWP